MTEARDLREHTRALDRNTKAITALNATLAEIERARKADGAVIEKAVNDFRNFKGTTAEEALDSARMGTEGLYGVCSNCMMHKCLPGSGAVTSPSCACCKSNHYPV